MLLDDVLNAKARIRQWETYESRRNELVKLLQTKTALRGDIDAQTAGWSSSWADYRQCRNKACARQLNALGQNSFSSDHGEGDEERDARRLLLCLRQIEKVEMLDNRGGAHHGAVKEGQAPDDAVNDGWLNRTGKEE